MNQLLHLLDFAAAWEGVPALVLVGASLSATGRARVACGLAAGLGLLLLWLEGGGGLSVALAAAAGAIVGGTSRSFGAWPALPALAAAWWLGGVGAAGWWAAPTTWFAFTAAVGGVAVARGDRLGWAALLGLGLLLSFEGRARIADGAACLALLAGLAIGVRVTARAGWAVAALGLAWSAASVGERGPGGYVHPEGVDVVPTMQARVVARGFKLVSGLAVASNGDVYVGEFATSRILRVRGGVSQEVARVEAAQPVGYRAESWEAGLWGLAIDPSGDWVYTMAAASFRPGDGPPVGTSRVERRRIGEELGPPQVVLADLPAGAIHSGGAIAFGPDGTLYVSVGEAGGSEHPLAGTVLRVRPDGSPPADNPEPGSPVFARGLRNPYGLAFDAAGTLFATDNGPHCCDRLLRLPPGADAGWPRYSGAVGDAELMAADPAVTAPLWDSGGARISPTGLVVEGGDGSLRLRFATWHTAAVHDVRLVDGEVVAHSIALDARTVRAPADSPYAFAGGFSALTRAPDGSLWWASVDAVGRLEEP